MDSQMSQSTSSNIQEQKVEEIIPPAENEGQQQTEETAKTGININEDVQLPTRNIPFEWNNKKAIKEWLDKTNQQQKRFSSSAPAAVNVDVMRFDLQQTTVEKKFQSVDEMHKVMQEGYFKEKNREQLINYSHFLIPDTEWTIVRPHECERRLAQTAQNLNSDELRLPAVPSENVFYIKREGINNVCEWKMPVELKKNNGANLLANNYKLLSHQQQLIELIYTVANYPTLQHCIKTVLNNTIGDQKELNDQIYENVVKDYPLYYDYDVQNLLCNSSFYYFELEEKMLEIFNARKKTGTEKKKCCSNYLLIDPREFAIEEEHKDISFERFINAIFYVGKTSTEKERPFSHMQNVFRENLEIKKRECTSFKRHRINEIWNAKRGVIVLLIFTNIEEQEAYVREACMIQARRGKHSFLRKFDGKDENPDIFKYWQNTILGPVDLTNKKDELEEKKKVELKMNESDIAKLGSRLLFRAYGIFRLERHEELYKKDFEKFKKPDDTAGSSKGTDSDSSQSIQFSPSRALQQSPASKLLISPSRALQQSPISKRFPTNKLSKTTSWPSKSLASGQQTISHHFKIQQKREPVEEDKGNVPKKHKSESGEKEEDK